MIEGGQTMNPSTEAIVAAVDATPATEVIVLPNNSNVILSAEQAATLAEEGGVFGEAIGSGGVLVTGSVVTVGEARSLLRSRTSG